MKSGSFWVRTDWKFDNKDRRRLLELLNRSEQRLSELERAVSFFKSARDPITDSTESPTQIKRDLEDIKAAIQMLTVFQSEGGTAWALFKGEALDEIDRLRSLSHALDDGRLQYAAEQAQRNYQAERGRPPSPHVSNRKQLFNSVLRVAEHEGIAASRDGEFMEIVETVYGAIGESGAEGDIREHLKTVNL